MATTRQASESVRMYEIGYVVAPTVPEDEVANIASDLQSAITDVDGEVLASQVPEARDLAYTMEATTSAGEREFERGQFGWVQFSVDTSDLSKIESVVEDETDVMRALTVKITEEDLESNKEEESVDSDSADNEDDKEEE
jgi:ribosomal protein S6